MDSFTLAKECHSNDPTDPTNNQGQIYVQLILSLALGFSAFFGFCFLRPRWKSLYAARKRQSDSAKDLPELPDTFFGWMPVLYRVTEQQVLAAAGLDAYVFLAFFKMSMKLFGIMFLIACAILAPINNHFTDPKQNPFLLQSTFGIQSSSLNTTVARDGYKYLPETSYLWAYLVFTYFFTGLAIYLMTAETKKIITIRQDYLGSQSTVTDRTIKLSGIPLELRSEEKLKELLEKLEIGKVENITICRNWKNLDKLMDERASVLRRLEEAWTVHLGRSQTKPERSRASEENGSWNDNEDETSNTHEDNNLMGRNHITSYDQPRPSTRMWYGFLNFQSKKIDSIDYHEEKLRKLDEKIKAARKKEYTPTALAFVTMDSIPACQMAVQALLDPSPMQLLAKLAPAPTDIVWRNTYMPRSHRMARSWLITIFILVLTIFWLIPVAALAGLLDLCSIKQVWPQLANFLEDHTILKSLVQTGLPTIVVSLLSVAVPFLYDYLANLQGMISQGDVELSVISKNFFFTFFNVFLVFTAFGTASNFWPVLQHSLKDTTKIAFTLAKSVQRLAVFYINFILLQGVGLFPFRLLEFGSVSLYPIMLMGSRTPRDYAELVQPPLFKYGFYLPSAILVYVLCIVYSILPAGYMILFFGLIYFVFGYYTYKYQLLYAMDHPQHATGGAWPMTCYRLMIGIGVFQLVMAGIIALQNEPYPAALIIPLLLLTVWYSYYFSRTYEPLMKFIALRSIRRHSNVDINIADEIVGIARPPGYMRRASTTVGEHRELGMVFINPNMISPLEKLWIPGRSDHTDNIAEASRLRADGEDQDIQIHREESASSTVSLGDTHIWRDNGDENV